MVQIKQMVLLHFKYIHYIKNKGGKLQTVIIEFQKPNSWNAE